MRYNEKYNLFVDDDLVIYRWDKNLDKLVQVKPYKTEKGYLQLSTKIGVRKAHTIIWETFNGEIPDGYQIDHINTIRNDNRLENLRVVTPKENSNNPLTLKHMSEAVRGRKLSEKHKKNISNSHKGKKMSEETRQKMSESRQGMVLSEETKRKIAESKKGKVHSDFAIKFKEYCEQNNVKLNYKTENSWYCRHNRKCRWEK